MSKKPVSIVLTTVLATAAALPTLGAGPVNPGGPQRACNTVSIPHVVRCFAWIQSSTTSPTPTGLSPATIKATYNFPTSMTAGQGQTIALVDAYDAPHIESDLGVFSAQYGLPACTTANGCFTKVDQRGGNHYPAVNAGWAYEISLDVEWAHAIAPGAHILLVEADSAYDTDLYAAEDYAAAHAGYISNSWGENEYAGEATNDVHFSRPGVSFFAASGDSGTPAIYPSASPYLISVGGTTLHNPGQPNFTETGWGHGILSFLLGGSGGGCSRYESANPAQRTGSINCNGKRATPDVSLDADPASGVSVYDSTRYLIYQNWSTVGGTSASSPMWAARAAAAGVIIDAAYVYGNVITYRDITSGNNGQPARTGYDLVTGRGSWIGSTP